MTEEMEYAICHAAIDTFGPDSQLRMVIEESTELVKEICKFWRGKDNKDQIAEETADVEIMLEQIKIMFGIEADVEAYKEKKLERLKNTLLGTE